MKAFGLELMGDKQVRNYYHDWSEWGVRSDLRDSRGLPCDAHFRRDRQAASLHRGSAARNDACTRSGKLVRDANRAIGTGSGVVSSLAPDSVFAGVVWRAYLERTW